MGTDSYGEILCRMKEAWSYDKARNADYIIHTSSPMARIKSSFDVIVQISADVPTCTTCDTQMLQVADLHLSDASTLTMAGVSTVTVHVCPNDNCKKSLYSALNGPWATYHWRDSSIARLKGKAAYNQAWLAVTLSYSAEEIGSSRISPVQSSLMVQVDEDIIDPIGFGWFPEDGLSSHVQQIMREIPDKQLFRSLYKELVRDFPRWHDAKFGGYPHWRSLQMDGGCECSMRGTLVFTFSHDLCPLLCPEGVSAWLFLCKQKPLQHSISLIFQQDPSDEQLAGGVAGDALLPL